MGNLETKIPPIGTNIKNFEALKYELTNKDPAKNSGPKANTNKYMSKSKPK